MFILTIICIIVAISSGCLLYYNYKQVCHQLDFFKQKEQEKFKLYSLFWMK
jgi:hypothetical protein